MPVRESAAWLPVSLDSLRTAIVRRALKDIGICEMPPGSNRSGRIDEYNKMAGAPAGSYWCASAAGAWWREAADEVGFKIQMPTGYASCDNWLRWAKTTGRFSQIPNFGSAVLYGVGEDATHIGVVVRIDPLMLTVEGNTSIAGNSRNGVAVDLKDTAGRKVLGFATPTP